MCTSAIAEGPRVVARGVDTLKVGFKGLVPPGVRAEVKELLKEGQARESALGPPKMELAGIGGWKVLPPPPKFYDARLVLDGFGTLLLGRDSFAKNADLVWEPECRRLWAEGWDGCWRDGEAVARRVFQGEPSRQLLSRVDLCLDLAGTTFGRDDPREFTTRAKFLAGHGPEEEPEECQGKWREYRRGPRRETLAFGKGATVVRIYDKLAEIIEASHKTWFLPIWSEGGARPGEPVWRVECQLRRSRAGKLGKWEVIDPASGESCRLDSREGLALGLRTLWRSVVGDPDSKTGAGAWLTQRIPSENEEPRRWPIPPQWRVVQAGFDGPAGVLVRSLPDRPNLEQTEAQWWGVTLAYWAQLLALEEREELARVVPSPRPLALPGEFWREALARGEGRSEGVHGATRQELLAAKVAELRANMSSPTPVN